MNNSAALLLALPGLLWAQPAPLEHAETSIAFSLPAPPATVFPLFGPVRESEWSPHWRPHFVYPATPAQQQGAVFTTGKDRDEMVWALATYDPAALRIVYLVVWPGMRLTALDIALQPAPKNTSQVSITYRETALSEAGNESVKSFAAEFPSQRDHWQHALTHRLDELK
jgi:hypothetical protein